MIPGFDDPESFKEAFKSKQSTCYQGSVFFRGYKQCYRALRHPNLLNDHHQLVDEMKIRNPEIIQYKKRTLLGTQNREDRIEHRRRFSAFLSAPYRGAMRCLFRTQAYQLTNTLEFNEGVDLMGRYCQPLVAKTFCKMFGLDEGDWRAVYVVSDGAHRVFDRQLEDRPIVERSFEELFSSIRVRVADRIREATQTSALGIQFLDSEFISHQLDEKCDFVSMMLEAGVANTVHQIGLVIVSILQTEWAWSYLRNNRGCLKSFIREGIRLRSRSGTLVRSCVRDSIVSGVKISRGDLVHVQIWSAHRDPRTFPNPHEFNPFRPRTSQLLTFGGGLHMCLGSTLALEVATIAIEALLDSSFDGNLSDFEIAASKHSAACYSVLAS